MRSISDLTQTIYMDLFIDDPLNVSIGFTRLNQELKKVDNQETMVLFDDWTDLSNGKMYDDEWTKELHFDLTKRAFQFNLHQSAWHLFEEGEYKNQSQRFLELTYIAIDNASLKCIDIIAHSLIHPGAELYVGGPTLLSYALSMGSLIVAEYLYQHGLHPDGLKVIDAQGTFEDYSDVDFTVEYGSCLVYIMTSPHLSLLEKNQMMRYVISNWGVNPNGHSPQATCFDSPIQVAASIHICLLEFFLSLEVDINYSIDELIFYAVSSKACFDQKQKILELLIDEYDIDINKASERTGYSPVEWATLKNGKDAYETVNYLIERGAVYDVNTLMELAQEHHHFGLRDTLYHELYGSEGIYQDLLNQEVEIRATLAGDGEPRIIVVFPEKGY